jgi:hypothetical protein
MTDRSFDRLSETKRMLESHPDDRGGLGGTDTQ